MAYSNKRNFQPSTRKRPRAANQKWSPGTGWGPPGQGAAPSINRRNVRPSVGGRGAGAPMTNRSGARRRPGSGGPRDIGARPGMRSGMKNRRY